MNGSSGTTGGLGFSGSSGSSGAIGGTGAFGGNGSTGSFGASGAVGASGSSGSTGAVGSSGAQGFFKNGTSILFGNCADSIDRPPLFLCEHLTIGRSYVCLETTDVFMCIGASATASRDYFGRTIGERLNTHAVRAPGDCTDLEPCWQSQGDMRRGFYDSNDYAVWLLVLGVMLGLAFLLIVGLIVVLLMFIRRSREHDVQIQSIIGNGGQGVGEPGIVGSPDLSAYGYSKGGSNSGGGDAFSGEEILSPGRTSLMSGRLGRQHSNLMLSEDGSVVRSEVDDAETVEARIASNSGWNEQSRLSGMNTADMAMQATVGNTLDEPEVPKPSPVPLRARLLMGKTYSKGFGQGLQIDSYSGDAIQQLNEEGTDAANEEPMVL